MNELPASNVDHQIVIKTCSSLIGIGWKSSNNSRQNSCP